MSPRTLLCLVLLVGLLLVVWTMRPPAVPSRPPAEAVPEAPLAVTPEELPPFRVARVVDGDTVDVVDPAGEVVRVRVLGIDAPERAQPGGDAATAWAWAALEEGEAVELVGDDRDRWGRRLAEVRHDGGRDLGAGLVEAGHAWRWQHADRPDLETLAAEARAAGRGCGRIRRR
ncbi:thermonuclease family protein [Phycisphaera mikurensis]|uniref:thermonuclease family protein n=1 Tax=Phycisphaera mikurensis TaxID=547188 RepID=UPI0012B5ED5A|nr:thermonuclease family protein [Phycisphaera mikurensis]MBB6440670.1 endonuclease YncB(thermonuclease family) [Phycisphaera mikurensis]